MSFLEEKLDKPLSDVINILQMQILSNNKYFGIQTLKNPLDFWVYQEIIFEIKPDVIIEIGNFRGGSTLALAHILDNINTPNSKILALDIDHSSINEKVIKHNRIKLITGNALTSLRAIKGFIKDTDKVLIIEDSSHIYEDTLEILRLYSDLVTIGSYFIIEDSIVDNGLYVPYLKHNGGPYRAIKDFIQENNNFEIDRTKEKFVITWNPKGFLKRVK